MNDNSSEFGGREVVGRFIVGSHNYNLNTPSSDMDWKYFVCPTFEDLYSGKMFSNAKQSETMDYDVHDVRQLGNLLWKSNINFIEVLFSRSESWWADGLDWIFANREDVATMNIPAFRAATYGTHYQKMNALLKGTAKTDILIERFGYDTKQACHAMRMLFSLEQFANTHVMEQTLYYENSNGYRQVLLDVKAGAYSLADFKEMVDSWHRNIGPDVLSSYNCFTPNEEVHNKVEEVLFSFIKEMISN
jgi:predicted nucleotidyltransferase